MEKRAAAGLEGAPGARAQLAVVCLGEWAGRVRVPRVAAPPRALTDPLSGRGIPGLRTAVAPARRPRERPAPLARLAPGLGGRLWWRSPGSRPARSSARSPG